MSHAKVHLIGQFISMRNVANAFLSSDDSLHKIFLIFTVLELTKPSIGQILCAVVGRTSHYMKTSSV